MKRSVMGDPVPRNRRPIAQPNAVMSPNVLENSRQGTDAPRAADDPAMQAYRHHARAARRSHLVEPIEGISAVGEEILTGAEVTAALQAAIIGVEGVRDRKSV